MIRFKKLKICLTVDSPIILEIDRLVEAANQESDGSSWTRSSLINELLADKLSIYEPQSKGKKK